MSRADPPTPKDDSPSNEEPVEQDLTLSEPWAYPPILPISQADENSHSLALSPPNWFERQGDQEPEEKQMHGESEDDVINNRAAGKVGLGVGNNMAAPLHMLQNTNRHVLSRVFDLNLARAPFFREMEDLILFLQDTVRLLAGFSNSVSLPEGIQSKLDELRRNVENVSKVQFESLREQEHNRINLEDDIIQSLYRSNRYLDRLLGPDVRDWPTSQSYSPILSSDDLETRPGEYTTSSAANDRYLSQVGDVDMIKERLRDLRSRRAGLLEEQDSRAHFGLSLDEESLHFLQTFEQQEQILLGELEYAEMGLHALQELVRDEEANRAIDATPTDVSDEDEATVAQLKGLMPPDVLADLPTVVIRQSTLHKQMQSVELRFGEYVHGQSAMPVDPVNFINAWLLHRLQHLPHLLSMHTTLVEEQYPEISHDDLLNVFMEKWFGDSTPVDFAYHRAFADQQSMQANLADSQQYEQRSLSALTPRPMTIPLLRMGPTTTAQDIIAQALQSQGIVSSSNV